jgi:transketolase
MAGRTLFLKFNAGPSGHGMAPAAGEALALKLAGVEEVKVFVMEGEGGLTPGASHETKNTAWGLGLSNLVFLVDWNDFGIDPRPTSESELSAAGAKTRRSYPTATTNISSGAGGLQVVGT